MKIQNIHSKPIILEYINNVPKSLQPEGICEVDWSDEKVEKMKKRKIIKVLEEKKPKRKKEVKKEYDSK